MMMKNDVCGIYLITNKMTGQMYVGQSIRIYRRFDEHRRAQGFGHSRIDNTINKYGAENFSFEIIMTIENDIEKLNNAEREWIAILNTYEDDFHYNLTPGGDFNPMKIPEIVAKISGDFNPAKLPEVRAKISKANSGKKHSEETRKKISEALSGENHPMYGKKLSEETRKKISEALSGKKLSEEHRKKLSKANSGENNPMYGKKLSEEHRKKISEAKSGKKHSKEHRKKMSEARNTTGYYRVSKIKNPAYTQGFYYRYEYRDDDSKKHQIYSVDIKKLEKKVKAKGLEWFKLEE